MALYGWKGRNFEVDPSAPKTDAVCDRCGFRWNLEKLQWQYDYRGTSIQNTRLLVCPPCYDVPQPQLAPIILPPDPPFLFNTRPEPYSVDETSWLTLEDGSKLDTESGDPLITSLPNPSTTESITEEATVNLTTEDGEEITTEAGEGNPLDLEPNPGTNPSNTRGN